MGVNIICDVCGESIDTSKPYITGSAQVVPPPNSDGSLPIAAPYRFDFCPEHVPVVIYPPSESKFQLSPDPQ